MEADLEIILQLLAAFAIGILIGIERGWSSQQDVQGDRVGGIRTFSLIGLLGGIAGMLTVSGGDLILATIFAAVAAVSIASYFIESRRNEDLGTTTVYTRMLTFALGAWAAAGYHMYALGTTVFVMAILGMKPFLHSWIKGVESKELYAGIKLLIISLVLLPLLPNEGFGPWDSLNPRWIWYMVVMICGISFVGYFTVKYIGNRLGMLVTSITGGLASSTAVTLSMAGFAKRQEGKSIFMAAVMIASSIMFIRVTVEVFIVNHELLELLWLPLVVMFVSVLGGGLWIWNRYSSSGEAEIDIENPFNIGTALKFGLFLAVVLLLSNAMNEWLGDQGIYILSVVSGLMDVDAITLSLSRLALNDISHEVAVRGIIIATSVNTLVKSLMFALFVGFRESLKLIVLMLLAGILGIVSVWSVVGM